MYVKDNHLGNVLATVSDRKISVDVANDGTTDYFTGEVLSANDYYAFGGTMPGRSFNGGYRYGFNGKEKDNETSTQDYGMRIYNPNLGKFLSVDPISNEYPWNSTYAFAENRPIDGIDLDGEEWLSGLLDLYDKTIPQLEAANANKTLVYSAKVLRGMMNSTLEGQVCGMGNELKSTYNSAEKLARNPQSIESRQFVKELIKFPDAKAGEGLYNVTKGALQGDPDDLGFAAGTLLQMGVMKVGMPKTASSNPNPSTNPNTSLVLYDAEFAVQQGLEGGSYNFDNVRGMIPEGTPNTFQPSETILQGEKFKFEAGGKKVELKWHSPDSKAPAGSNSATGNTAQIKVGNKLLNNEGNFQKKPDNNTHIKTKGN